MNCIFFYLLIKKCNISQAVDRLYIYTSLPIIEFFSINKQSFRKNYKFKNGKIIKSVNNWIGDEPLVSGLQKGV